MLAISGALNPRGTAVEEGWGVNMLLIYRFGVQVQFISRISSWSDATETHRICDPLTELLQRLDGDDDINHKTSPNS